MTPAGGPMSDEGTMREALARAWGEGAAAAVQDAAECDGTQCPGNPCREGGENYRASKERP